MIQQKQRPKASFKLVRTVLSFAKFGLFFIAITGVFLYTRADTPTHVKAATSDTINFQARLLNSSGSIVTDGTYNVEFKLYNVSTGGAALWSETRLTTDIPALQVQVRSGYLTVHLGAKTVFPSTIAWDQNIYLTMNIGGTGGAPSWDGEMTPRLKLTAVPFAFAAKQLSTYDGTNTGVLKFGTIASDPVITLPDEDGTVCLQNATSCGFATTGSGSFIKNQITQQTNANFNILSAGETNVGALIQAANSATAPVLVLKNGTTPGAGSDLLQLQDSAGNVNAFFNSTGNQLTLGRIGASGTVTQGKLILADGTTDNFGLTIQVATLAASRVYSFPDSPGNATDTVCLLTLSNCAGGTLQTAYNASTGGTTPEIKLDTTRGAVNIQDANTSLGAAVDLFAVNGSNGSGLGSTLFNVQGNGNVGIGVALPTNNLQIGNLTGVSTATPKTLSLGGTYSNTPGLNPKLKIYEDNTGAIGIGVSENQLEFDVLNTTTDHVFYAGGNELMRVVGTGKVGIGTTGTTSATNLLNKLHVFTATVADGISIDGTNSPAINFRNNDGTAGTAGAVKAYLGIASVTNAWATGVLANDVVLRTEDATNGNIRFITQGSTGGVISQTITRAGDVGIGIVVPTARLHVVGADQTTVATAATDTLRVIGGAGGVATASANGGAGSAMFMTGGTGGASTSAFNSGNGGAINITGGVTGSAGGTGIRGTGGVVNITGGSGNGGGSSDGGTGGNVIVKGGVGGDSNNAGVNGGTGGNITIQGGTAGFGNTGATGGNGGTLSLQGGDGSAAGSGASSGGNVYVVGGGGVVGAGTVGNVKLGITSAGVARGNIVIGAADTTGQLLVLDTKIDAEGGLAGTPGAMYYNSFTDRFRCFQGIAWKDCDVTSAGVFLAKNSVDTSTASASLNNWVYAFTNSSLLASGVLKLDNGANATNSALVVTGGANPTSGQALIFASNTNGSPTGNLLDLQSGSSPTSKFSVSAAGLVTLAGGQTVDITTPNATIATTLTIKPGTSSGSSNNGRALVLTGGDASGTTSVIAGAVTITGGSATGITGTRTGGNVTIDAGTGATSNGSILLGGTNDSAILLGATSGTQTLTFGRSTVGQTLNIGNATVANGNTQTVNIGTSASGTGKNVITLGSSNGASSLNLLSGVNNSGNITVGTSDANATLFVVDTKTDAEVGLAGTPGAMYYNSSLGKFRCYEVSSWANCVASASGVTGSGTTNRVAYWNSGTSLTSSDNFFFDGTSVGIGTTSVSAKLHVVAPNQSTSATNAVDVLKVTGGSGGTAVAAGAAGGNGSIISLITGAGGDANTGAAGGNGGAFTIQTGDGGIAVTGQTRGNGGALNLQSGQGGGGSGGSLGHAGQITIQAGNGGSAGGATTNTMGNGGSVSITSGNGGTAPGTSGTAGDAGVITLQGGNAGNTGGTGKVGGSISLTGGTGTLDSSSTGTKTGGAINLTGGTAGHNASGGNVVINGGASGTGGSTTVGNLLFQNNVLGKILIGTPCAVGTTCTGQDSNVQQFVLDASSILTSNEPSAATSSNGAMYYNTNVNKFRCFQAGAWVDCISATGGTASLQSAYDNSGNPATITEIDGKGIVIQGTQPTAQTVANGTNATTLLTATAAKGGNTSLVGGTGGVGGALSFTTGAGGNATGATGTGGNGGNITLQGGAGGTGNTAAGSYGNLLLQTSGGLVGVGTATPNYKLGVVTGAGGNTQIRFGATNADDGGFLTSAGSSNVNLSAGTSWNGANWIAKATSATILGGFDGEQIFYGNTGLTVGNSFTPTERMRINTLGNVGIGTAGPDRKLDVLDAANPQLRLTQTDGSVFADLQVDTNGDFLLNVDGQTNQLVLDNGGNVGIGTNTPGAKLQVYKDNTVGSGTSFIFDVQGAQTVAKNDFHVGIRGYPSYSATTGNTLANLMGLQGVPVNSSTGTITNNIGVQSAPVNNSTGVVTNNVAFWGVAQNNSTGTITNNFGYYVENPINSGTITNNWGIYVNDQTNGTITNKYAIVTAVGAGNIGFGDVAPSTAKLVVRGIGANGATAGLNITNSNGTSALYVRDDGAVGVKTTTPFDNVALTVKADFAVGGGDKYGLFVYGEQSVANANDYRGIWSQPSYTATSGTLTQIVGVMGRPINNSPGTITHSYGVLGIPDNINGGTITNAYGLYGRIDNLKTGGSGTNTIGTAYGAYIAAPSNNGTITTKYGLVVENGAGNVGIGDASPLGLFTVGSGDLFQVSSAGQLTFNGVATDITTGTDEDLTLIASGTGQIILNDTIQIATLSTAGTIALCRNASNQVATCNTGVGPATLQSTYDGSTADPEIKLSLTRGALNIQDANTTIGATADLFAVHASNAGGLGTVLFNVKGGGNVGIATSSPNVKLDVAGSTRITGSSSTVLTGSINPTASTSVTGVGTLFLTELNIGDRITVSGETRTVVAIASNTALTVDVAFTDTANDISVDRLPSSLVIRNASSAYIMNIQDNNYVGIGTLAPTSSIELQGAFQSIQSADALDSIALLGGQGGNTNDTNAGGKGGLVTIRGGQGGAGSATAATGIGGKVFIKGGSSGLATDGATKSAGGDVEIESGSPGGGSNRGGDAGVVYIKGADGGTTQFSSAQAGLGGRIILQGGQAGLPNGATPGARNNGGHISITGGGGNAGSVGAAGTSSGGDVFIVGGATGTGGTDGDVVLGSTSDGTIRGNVGVGVTAPAFKLDVSATNAVVAQFNRSNDGTLINFASGGSVQGSISISLITTSYNAFTGSHYSDVVGPINTGELVRFNGINSRLHNNPEAEILYGTTKTSIENDSTVLGAYLSLENPNQPYSTDNPHLVMAVGNGVMWVVDEGENISAGDYFISASTPGHARKDPRTAPTSYIVGRAAEDVDWSTVSSTIGGKKHKLVSVTYEVFSRDNVIVPGQILQAPGANLGTLNVGGLGSFGSLNVSGMSTMRNLAVTDNITAGTLKVTGTASFAGDIRLEGAVNTRQVITKRFKASGPITAGQVVVLDTTQDGYVTTTTSLADTKIIGVAVQTVNDSGDEIEIAIGGSIQVQFEPTTPVLPGDLITTGTSAGKASNTAVTPANGSVLGKATSAKDANNLAWILILMN